MKKNIKKIYTIIIATVLIAILMGCQNTDSGNKVNDTGSINGTESLNDTENIDDTESTAGEKDEKLIPLKQVAANNLVAHANSIVAHASGLYEKEGLDVEMSYATTNGDQIQAVINGKVDVGATSATATLQYIDQGADLVIIGGQMTEGASVFALPERADEFSEISEETLAGKKIGVTRLQTGDIALRKYLTEQGADLSKIEFVELDTPATVIEAIKKGEVDLGSVMLTYRQVAEEQGLVPVSHLDELWPGFICCRLFVTRETLENRREDLVKVLKANIEAYNLIQTDHDAAIGYALEEIEVEEDDLREQMYDYGHLTLDPNPSIEDTKKFYESMVNIGYADGNVDITDYIDATLFEEALDELLEEYPDNEVYKALKEESDRTNF